MIINVLTSTLGILSIFVLDCIEIRIGVMIAQKIELNPLFLDMYSDIDHMQSPKSPIMGLVVMITPRYVAAPLPPWKR